jgi:predicted RNA-binding Zn ribbon-like protein
MVNTSALDKQAAPGSLEDVRQLLNSWLIPNETRVAEDRFEAYADERTVPTEHRPPLRQLRDELRPVVGNATGIDDVLNAWMEIVAVRPHVVDGSVTYRHAGGLAGQLVTATLSAVASGRWQRLKACPDCRWVFYDHTRNGSKRWCLMTAGGPEGRSCGSIAKVSAYRRRARIK